MLATDDFDQGATARMLETVVRTIAQQQVNAMFDHIERGVRSGMLRFDAATPVYERSESDAETTGSATESAEPAFPTTPGGVLNWFEARGLVARTTFGTHEVDGGKQRLAQVTVITRHGNDDHDFSLHVNRVTPGDLDGVMQRIMTAVAAIDDGGPVG